MTEEWRMDWLVLAYMFFYICKFTDHSKGVKRRQGPNPVEGLLISRISIRGGH